MSVHEPEDFDAEESTLPMLCDDAHTHEEREREQGQREPEVYRFTKTDAWVSISVIDDSENVQWVQSTVAVDVER